MSWYLEYLHPIHDKLLATTHPHFQVLQHVLDAITTARPPANLVDRLVAIIDLAHKAMPSSPSQTALYQWRCLHTDACIIRSVLLLEDSTPLEAVASLDSAIIVSGATGNDRMQIIQGLIQEIQDRHFPTTPFNSQLPYPARGLTTINQIDSAARALLQFENSPTLFSFQSKLFQEPFVISAYAKDWPALQDHPWRLATYLRSISGAGRIVPVEVGNDYRSDDWSQKFVSWDEFLSTLDFVDQPACRSTEVMYLAQHNLFMQFPALWADIMIPDYIYADLDTPNHIIPDNDERLITNVWLGPRGTISPAHTDPYHNVYGTFCHPNKMSDGDGRWGIVQLVGEKTVWLAPPGISSWMYPGTKTLSMPSVVNDPKPELSNTTTVNVFAEKSTYETEYPGFWEQVVPAAMSYTLSAGDLLYIPAGWWHGMRSEDTSFSISMWF